MLAKILSTILLANPENVKDRATSVFAVVFVVCGAILATNGEVISGRAIALPWTLLVIAKVLLGVSVALTMLLTGKNPDLSKKTDSQADAINNLPK